MRLDEMLRRYCANQFTDQDVIRCTNLSERKWRELSKDKLVRTVTHRPGRGQIRLCDATTLKRTAAIASLNQAGLSLAASAQIAYFAPFHTALYEIIDPCTILLNRSVAGDPDRLPPRLPNPRAPWFDQNRPARAEPDSDWWIEIHEYRFVTIKYGPQHSPVIFGDLRDAGTRFVAWIPMHQMDKFVGSAIEKLGRELRANPAAAYAAWENPTLWSRELKTLGYNFEQHSDDVPLRAAAAAVMGSPLFTIAVNVSLAIRKTLRRYLGLEPAEPASS
jgi:hypothetical protein